MLLTLITPIRKFLGWRLYNLHPVWLKKTKVLWYWCVYNSKFFLSRRRREVHAKRIIETYLNEGFEYSETFIKENIDIDKDFFTLWLAERDLYIYNLTLKDRKKYKMPFIRTPKTREFIDYPVAFMEPAPEIRSYFAIFALDFSLDVQYAGRASLIYVAIRRLFINFLTLLSWAGGYVYFVWRRFIFPGLRLAMGFFALSLLILFIISPLYWCGPGLSWALRRRFGIPIHVSWTHAFWDFCNGPGFILLAVLVYLLTGMQISRVRVLSRRNKKGISRIPLIQDAELYLIPIKLGWIKITTPLWNPIYDFFTCAGQLLLNWARKVSNWYTESYLLSLVWPTEEEVASARPYTLFVVGFKLLGTRPWSFVWHLGGRIGYYIAWEAKNFRRFVVPKVSLVHEFIGKVLNGLLTLGVFVKIFVMEPEKAATALFSWPLQKIVTASNFIVTIAWPGATKPTHHAQARFWARSFARMWWSVHYVGRSIFDGIWFAVLTATGFYLIIVILGPLGARGFFEWAVVLVVFTSGLLVEAVRAYRTARAKRQRLQSLSRQPRRTPPVSTGGGLFRSSRIWASWLSNLVWSKLTSARSIAAQSWRRLSGPLLVLYQRVKRISSSSRRSLTVLVVSLQDCLMRWAGVVVRAALGWGGRPLLSLVIFLGRLAYEVISTLAFPVTALFKLSRKLAGLCNRPVKAFAVSLKRHISSLQTMTARSLLAVKLDTLSYRVLSYAKRFRCLVASTGTNLLSFFAIPIRAVDTGLSSAVRQWLLWERGLLRIALRSRRGGQLANLYYTSNTRVGWVCGCVGWVWFHLVYATCHSAIGLAKAVPFCAGVKAGARRVGAGLHAVVRVGDRAFHMWLTLLWSVTIFCLQAIKRLLWAIIVWPISSLYKLARWGCTARAVYVAAALLCSCTVWAALEQVRLSPTNLKGHVDFTLLMAQVKVLLAFGAQVAHITVTNVGVKGAIIVWQLSMALMIVLLLSTALLLFTGFAYVVFLAVKIGCLYELGRAVRLLSALVAVSGISLRPLRRKKPQEAQSFQTSVGPGLTVGGRTALMSLKIVGFWLLTLYNGVIVHLLNETGGLAHIVPVVLSAITKTGLAVGVSASSVLTVWAVLALTYGLAWSALALFSCIFKWLIRAVLYVWRGLATIVVKPARLLLGRAVSGIGLQAVKVLTAFKGVKVALAAVASGITSTALRTAVLSAVICFTPSGWGFLRDSTRLFVTWTYARCLTYWAVMPVAPNGSFYLGRQWIKGVFTVCVSFIMPAILSLCVWVKSLYHFMLYVALPERNRPAPHLTQVSILIAAVKSEAARRRLRILFLVRKCRFVLLDNPMRIGGCIFTGAGLVASFRAFWHTHCQPHTLLMALCSIPGTCFTQTIRLIRFYGFVLVFLPFEMLLIMLSKACVFWDKLRALAVDFYYLPTLTPSGAPGWKCRPFWRLVANHIWLLLFGLITVAGMAVWAMLDSFRFICTYFFWCISALFQAMVGALALFTWGLTVLTRAPQTLLPLFHRHMISLCSAAGRAWEAAVFASRHVGFKPRATRVRQKFASTGGLVGVRERFFGRILKTLYTYKQTVWALWRTPTNILGYTTSPWLVRAYCLQCRQAIKIGFFTAVHSLVLGPARLVWARAAPDYPLTLAKLCSVLLWAVRFFSERTTVFNQWIAVKLRNPSMAGTRRVSKEANPTSNGPTHPPTVGRYLPNYTPYITQLALTIFCFGVAVIALGVGLAVAVWTGRALLVRAECSDALIRAVIEGTAALQYLYSGLSICGVFLATGLVFGWCVVSSLFWAYYWFNYYLPVFTTTRTKIRLFRLEGTLKVKKSLIQLADTCRTPTRPINRLTRYVWTHYMLPDILEAKLTRDTLWATFRQRFSAYALLFQVRLNLVAAEAYQKLLDFALQQAVQKKATLHKLKDLALRDRSGGVFVRWTGRHAFAGSFKEVVASAEEWVDRQIHALLPKKLKPQVDVDTKKLWPEAYKLPKGGRPSHLVLSGFWYKDIRKQFWSEGKREGIVRLFERSVIYWRELPIHFWGPAIVESLFWVALQLAFPFSFWRVLRRTIRWRLTNMIKRRTTHPTFKRPLSRWWPVSSWAFNRDVFRWYVFWSYNPMHLNLVLHPRLTVALIYSAFRKFCSWFPLGLYDRLALRLRGFLLKHIWQDLCRWVAALAEKYVTPLYILVSDYAIKFGLVFEPFNWFVRLRMYSYAYFRLLEYTLRWPIVKPTLQWVALCTGVGLVMRWAWKTGVALVFAALKVGALAGLIVVKAWLSFARIFAISVKASVKALVLMITRQLSNDYLYHRWTQALHAVGRLQPLSVEDALLNMIVRLPRLLWLSVKYCLLGASMWVTVLGLKVGDHFLNTGSDTKAASIFGLALRRVKVWTRVVGWMQHKYSNFMLQRYSQVPSEPVSALVPSEAAPKSSLIKSVAEDREYRRERAMAYTLRGLSQLMGLWQTPHDLELWQVVGTLTTRLGGLHTATTASHLLKVRLTQAMQIGASSRIKAAGLTAVQEWQAKSDRLATKAANQAMVAHVQLAKWRDWLVGPVADAWAEAWTDAWAAAGTLLALQRYELVRRALLRLGRGFAAISSTLRNIDRQLERTNFLLLSKAQWGRRASYRLRVSMGTPAGSHRSAHSISISRRQPLPTFNVPTLGVGLVLAVLRLSLFTRRKTRQLLVSLSCSRFSLAVVSVGTVHVGSIVRFCSQVWASRAHYKRMVASMRWAAAPAARVFMHKFWASLLSFIPSTVPTALDRLIQWLLYGLLRLPFYTAKVLGGNILMLLSNKRFGTKLKWDFHKAAAWASGAIREAAGLAANWNTNSPRLVARAYRTLRVIPRQIADAFVHTLLWAFRRAWGWIDYWFRLESGLAVLLADFKWDDIYVPPTRRVLVPAFVRLILYALWVWWYVPTILRGIYHHVDYAGAKAHFVKHWRLGCNELWVGVGRRLASTETYVRLTAPRDYIMATGMRQERVHSHYMGAKRLPGWGLTTVRHVLVKRWDWRIRTFRFMLLWLLSYIVTFKSTVGRGVGMFAYHVSNAVLGFVWQFFARTIAVIFAAVCVHMLRAFLTSIATLPHFLVFLPVYAFIIIPPQAAIAVFKRRDPRVWLAVVTMSTTLFLMWLCLGTDLFMHIRMKVGYAFVHLVVHFCGAYFVASPALLDACQIGQLAWIGVASIWWYGHLAAPWKGRPLKALVPVVLLWYFVHIHDYGSEDYDVAAFAYFVLRKIEFYRSGETIVSLMHDITKDGITMPIWYDAYDHEWVRLKLSTYAPYLWMYLFIPFQFQCLFPWFVTHWDPDPETYRRKMSTPFVEVWRPLYTFWLFFFVGYYNLHFVEIASDYDCILGHTSGLGWPYSQGAYKFVNGIDRIRAFIEFHDVQMDVPINDLANMTTTVEEDWASVWTPPTGWSERLDNLAYHWKWYSDFYTAGVRGPRFGGANVYPHSNTEHVHAQPMIFETHLNQRGPSQPMPFQTYKRALWRLDVYDNELSRTWRFKPVKWRKVSYGRFDPIPYIDFRILFLPEPHTKLLIKQWGRRPVPFIKQLVPTIINYHHGALYPEIDLDKENWPTLLRTMGLGLSLEEVAAPLVFNNSSFFENQHLPYWDREKSWIDDMEIRTNRYLGPYNIQLTYDEDYDVWHEDPVWEWTGHPLYVKQESPFAPWPSWWSVVTRGKAVDAKGEALLALRPHKTWDLEDTSNWIQTNHPAYTRTDALGDFLYRDWTEFGLDYNRFYHALRLTPWPGSEPSERYSRLWYNVYVPPAHRWWWKHHEDGGLSMLPQLNDPALRKAMLREWIPPRSKDTGEYEYKVFMPGEEAYPYPPKLVHTWLWHTNRISIYEPSFAHALEPDQVDYRSSVMLFPQVEDTWEQAELHNESPSWEEWSGNPREESAVTWWDAAHGGWETEAFDENPLAFEYALFKHDGTPWHPCRDEFKAVPAVSRESSLRRWIASLTYHKDPWLTLPYRKEYWRVWRWDELEPWEHLDQAKFMWKFLDYIRRWFFPTEFVIWIVTGQWYIDTVLFISALYWDYVFLWNDWYKYIFKKHDYRMWLRYLKRHGVIL